MKIKKLCQRCGKQYNVRSLYLKNGILACKCCHRKEDYVKAVPDGIKLNIKEALNVE
jgi:hypothetical protein